MSEEISECLNRFGRRGFDGWSDGEVHRACGTRDDCEWDAGRACDGFEDGDYLGVTRGRRGEFDDDGVGRGFAEERDRFAKASGDGREGLGVFEDLYLSGLGLFGEFGEVAFVTGEEIVVSGEFREELPVVEIERGRSLRIGVRGVCEDARRLRIEYIEGERCERGVDYFLARA
jgi:hypothetical protein